MNNRIQIFFIRKSSRIFFTFAIFFFILAVLVFTPIAHGQYSNSPRQTGEEILEELLTGSSKFIIRVASNGCTDKDSFKVNIKKEAGVSPKAPYYALTITRVRPDECKAIVNGGVLIVFDLEKDLGLTGDFTYSITNRLLSSLRTQSADESLFSIIEKYFTFDFPELKEVKPEPFEKFAMDHDYFTCYLPFHWKLSKDAEGDEANGIFEVILTMPDKAEPGDEFYPYPDPLIYAGYYSENNKQQKTYQSYLQEYEKLVKEKAGSDRSRYQKMKPVYFNGKEAAELNYEVYLEIPRGPLAAIKYWLKVKFIVIKAEKGFYVLAYKSPREFYDRYLPVFEETAATFRTLF